MNSKDADLKRAELIEKQVERWDLFAKIAPVLFLLTSLFLLSVGAVGFDILFRVGMVLFALTAVSWWFWTIFSIRFLITILNRATHNLVEVSAELTQVKKEYKELRDEENRRS